VVRNPGIDAFADPLVEMIHIPTTEGWLESEHLINDAAQGPDIRFIAIGLIFPHFG